MRKATRPDITHQSTFKILPDEPPHSHYVVPAYYDYPLTIDPAGADVDDAAWGQSEGTRQRRQGA